MLIRFTQKLAKKLKIGSLAHVEDDPGPFVEWYANLFRARRAQYILTTESKSLLSVVMVGRGVTDDNIFIQHWLGCTREYLSQIGKSFVFENIVGPHAGQFVYAKTVSRSVLGSMSDMAGMSKFLLSARDLSPVDLSQLINETPFKAIDYQRPVDAFDKLKRLQSI